MQGSEWWVRMTATTRLAVLILMVGFVVEGVGELFELVSKQWLLSHVPNALLDIYYIGPATTVIGFLFAFAGRHEWSELHHRHVLHGHKVLLVSIALLGAAAGTIGLFAYEYPSAAVPVLLPWILGAVVAVGFGGSFLSYLLIGYHITSTRGKICLGGSLGWGAFVSIVAGYFVGSHFMDILTALRAHSTSVATTVSDLTFVTTILFVSYFLLAVGFHDAYRMLLRGVLPEGHTPAKKYRGPSKPAPAAQPVPPSSS